MQIKEVARRTNLPAKAAWSVIGMQALVTKTNLTCPECGYVEELAIPHDY
jgi:hypothetical protein